MKILGGLYTTGGGHTHTLWASLINDNDIADRHENHQQFFATVLDCQKNILILQIKSGDQRPLKKTGRHRKPNE